MQEIKVLGITCSPRKGKNTETLVREALAGAAEKGAKTELLSLAGLNIQPCTACDGGYSTGECIIEDDMRAIYPKLFAADGIVLGTPVYYWQVSAQAKILMDRTHCVTDQLSGKICGGIAVTGSRGAMNALTALTMFFLCKNMRPVLTGTPPHVPGVTAHAPGMHLRKEGRTVYVPGDVRKDERGMKSACELGRRIVEAIIEVN